MAKKFMMTATEVMDELGVSRAFAYKLMQKMNKELAENPRIFKALRNQLDELLQELRRLSNGENMSPELLETIHFIAIIMNGMKEESDD